jgi:polysaccharide export outer membrane protein
MEQHLNFKIFLVDDDPFSLEMNRQQLANLGYTEVTTFTDGQTCLNHLVMEPQVVIVDHIMAPMNGLDLLKKIKRFDPNIYIVFVSGQDDMKVAVDALKFGAFDYIIKGQDELEMLGKVMNKIQQVNQLIKVKSVNPFRRIFGFLSLMIMGTMLLTSCSAPNVFQKDASIKEDPSVFKADTNYQYRIRKDDKVSISVWDHDDLSVGSIYGIYNSNEVYGKWLLVGADGNITVPQLGEVNVAGKTILETEAALRKDLNRFIKNPVVEVKVLNKEVTVMGEMKSPGKFLLEKENNNLVELLGRAGDFDFYADRKNVQVIRDVNGESKSITVDLTQLENYTRSNIYLKPGDVVYVPTRKSKVWDKRSGSIIIPATAIITTMVLVATAIN